MEHSAHKKIAQEESKFLRFDMFGIFRKEAAMDTAGPLWKHWDEVWNVAEFLDCLHHRLAEHNRVMSVTTGL